jgi:hypothetical protein
MSVMRAYYKANYPGHFMGFVVHHYEN